MAKLNSNQKKKKKPGKACPHVVKSPTEEGGRAMSGGGRRAGEGQETRGNNRERPEQQ